MSARSINCECTYGFTCGYCCRNAKPYFFTPTSNGYPFAEGVARAQEQDRLGLKLTKEVK